MIASFTTVSKIRLVSTGYLSTTTVMQSVATTSSEKTQGIFTSKMCRDADAHYTTTSAMLIDNLTAKLYRTIPPLTNTIGQSGDPTSRISSANGKLTVRRWTLNI